MDEARRSIPFQQHLITATSKFQTPTRCGEATRREPPRPNRGERSAAALHGVREADGPDESEEREA